MTKASAPASDVDFTTKDLRIPLQRPSSQSSNGLHLDTFSIPIMSIAPVEDVNTAQPPSADDLLNSINTGMSCPTCEKHPKVVELADRWMERRLDGSLGAKVTLKAVHTIARSVHRYPLSVDSLRRHLGNCRAETYEKVKLRG